MRVEPVRVEFFKKLAGDEDYQQDERRWLLPGDSIGLSAETYVKVNVAPDGYPVAITIDGCAIRPNAFGEIVVECAVRAVFSTKNCKELSTIKKEIKPAGRIRRILDV